MLSLHFFGTFLTSTVLSSTHFHFMVVTDNMTSIYLVIQSHILGLAYKELINLYFGVTG